MNYVALSDEQLANHAIAMSRLEREVVMRCSMWKSLGYSRLAKEIGVTYDEVQAIGHRLQDRRLARVETVRLDRRFNGSALFLTKHGERVKRAVEILGGIRAKQAGLSNT